MPIVMKVVTGQLRGWKNRNIKIEHDLRPAFALASLYDAEQRIEPRYLDGVLVPFTTVLN